MSSKHAIRVVIGAMALTAAACGGSDDSTSEGEKVSTTVSAPPSTEPATTSPATTPPTVAATTPAASTTAAPASTAVPVPLYHQFLTVGGCFDDPPNSDFSTPVPAIDCAEPHDNEIFADGQFAAADDAPFPGSDAITNFAFNDLCQPAYSDFTGFTVDELPIPYRALTPDENDWAKGDRRVICVINNPGESLIGSVASAGLAAPKLRVLHVANIDGVVDLYISQQDKELVRVTSDPEEEQTYPPSIERETLRVVYSRFPVGDTAQADIVVFDPATKAITTLLATPFDESAPRLSPDGTTIVYHSSQEGEYDIWAMNADGSNPRRLTTNPGRDANPSWSPDGSKIVFRASNDDNNDIWVMNADGSGLERLTDDPAGDFDPVFSPDGTKIAFTSKRSGNFDIWLMNADGSDPVNLTNHPASDDYPSWTNDGRGITFTSNRFSELIWLMRADGSDQTLFTTTGPSVNGTAVGPIG